MLSDADLARLAEEYGLATPSIVIRELKGSGPAHTVPADAELNAGLLLPAASMMKLPIAAALCAAWAAGLRRRDERVLIHENNSTANDAQSPFVPGYEATLDELGMLMITRSDNVATNTLIDVLDREVMSEHLHSIGLTNTFVHRKLSGGDRLIEDPACTGERNEHPACDAAVLFERIAYNEIPGAAWLLAALQAQEWNEKLSRGLREGDRFAHKTGDTSLVTHDGGILDTTEGKRYIIVVYTSFASSPENDIRMQIFMKALRALL
jgi:beta-lactamase class A